jgi:hypothetical protein
MAMQEKGKEGIEKAVVLDSAVRFLLVQRVGLVVGKLAIYLQDFHPRFDVGGLDQDDRPRICGQSFPLHAVGRQDNGLRFGITLKDFRGPKLLVLYF